MNVSKYSWDIVETPLNKIQRNQLKWDSKVSDNFFMIVEGKKINKREMKLKWKIRWSRRGTKKSWYCVQLVIAFLLNSLRGIFL